MGRNQKVTRKIRILKTNLMLDTSLVTYIHSYILDKHKSADISYRLSD